MTTLTGQPSTEAAGGPHEAAPAAPVRAGDRRGWPLWAQVLLVLAVCAAVYWPGLGYAGFTATEGHRVIPGWTMLQSGDWLRSEMFELGYLRKPPGMSWAVAVASAVLGETEVAARAVSALSITATALLCALFAARWMGARWAAYAGVACAMMPLLWGYGRAAEIEALNTVMTAAAALALADLCLPRAASVGVARAAPMVLLAAVGILGAALAKGPASAPVLAGVPLGACLMQRSAAPLRRPGVWMAVGLAALAGAPIAAAVLGANAQPETVRQGIGEFLWRPDRIVGILLLPAVAFGAALPMSLGLLFPFGPDAVREGERSAADRRAADAARTLAGGWVLAVAMYTAVGLSNPRYVAPAAVLLPPLVAYAARGWMGPDPAFVYLRRVLARLAFGWWRGVAVAGLIIGATITIPLTEVQRARASGRWAGEAIAGALAPVAEEGGVIEIWADMMIETRPEVLLYAQRALAAGGSPGRLRPVWAKGAVSEAQLPPVGAYLLLKTTDTDAEPPRYAEAIERGELERVLEGKVHKFGYALYRVRGEGSSREGEEEGGRPGDSR